MIIGRHLGSTTFSARHRFTGSACQLTQWLSNSCIQLRTSGGVVTLSSNLIVTFPGQNTSVIGTLSSALSYNTPSPYIATSQRLSNISVTGSNFGPLLAVVPRTTGCINVAVLSQYSSAFVCNSSDLNIRVAGITVTEAAVSIVFSDTSRLDDLTILLRSPQGKEYTLMQSKCYGALPCGPSNSVAFNFQILPISQLIADVPLVGCPLSGTYTPHANDVSLLRSALLSNSAIGDWSLRVVTGSQNQNVTSSSLYFKFATLEFQIGNSSATSLVWFSDSSVSLKAPGYQDAQGAESSSGWGRNRTVAGLSSGFQSPSSCVYSYPDPVIKSASGAVAYLSSGDTRVQLVGSYFSNTNSNPRARMGLSVCVVTLWLSDTSLTCTQSPSLGSIRSFALTVERSAVAQFNSSLAFLPTQNGIINCSSVTALTASSLVTIVGAGFGVWDSSVRTRMTSLSLADATAWLCDTRISTKLLPLVRNSSGVIISLLRVVSNLSAVSVPERLIRIIACNSSKQGEVAAPIDQLTIASSGSNVVFVVAMNLGSAADNSVRVKLTLSSGQYSAWSSDSIIQSKSPWGFRTQTPELIVSMELSRGNSLYMFNFRAADVQHLTIVNESAIIMHLNGSDMSPFQRQSLVKIDQRTVAINWTSDSSINCAYPWPVSRDVVNFFVRFYDTSPSNALLSTSTPANPVFFPSSKPIAESLNVRWYSPAPIEVLENVNDFIQRGSATGWTFPTQQFSNPRSYFESELIDVDIVVYNNHTQVYVKDYAPVGVDLYSAVLLYDSANVLLNELICYGKSSLSTSTSLPRKTFATFFRSTFALCSIPRDVTSLTMSVVVIIQVRDELGAVLNFSTQPASVTVRARPQAVLVAQFGQANFSAGAVNKEPTIVSLGNAGANCSRLVFKYTVNVSCFSDQTYAPVPFFPDGSCVDGRGVFAVRNQIERSCDIDLQRWTFGVAGSCQIMIEALLFNSFLTIPIFIRAGDPNEMTIIGKLQSHIQEGGIIWSNNASLLKCLELSFQDKCNNTRNAGGFTCRLSGLLSNMSQYALLGQTSVDAGANGRCVWCSARMSRVSPLLIQLQVQYLQSHRYLQPLVNVSGPAEAAAVSVVTPSATNQTSAGNVMTPVTFRLLDALGVPVARSSTVIRVRIGQRTKTAAVR